MNTAFVRALGLDHPIVLGPMNNASSPQLCAAVCQAGGLGSFAAALLSPQAITQAIASIRALTSRPFNVNLFVLAAPRPDPVQIARALSSMQAFLQDHAVATNAVPRVFCERFEDQLAAVLAAAPPLVSFTFGIVAAEVVAQFHAVGSRVIGTATTVAEARAWAAVGADFICAQGAEAGGHRGTFLGDMEQSAIGSMALIPQIVDAVRIPVIAAGGIMDGRGIAAALMLGAQAVQMGTAFLSCAECVIAPAWKAALLTAQDDSTRMTRAFSGRPARGIVNRFTEHMRALEDDLPPYPIQNALTGPLRRAASAAGDADAMSLWAGQGVAMSRSLSVGALIDQLASETVAALAPYRN